MSSTFNIGLKVLRKQLEEQNTLGWYKAKLTKEMFKGIEVDAFLWVEEFLTKYHKLPTLDTAMQHYPDLAEVDCPENTLYYLDLIENRFVYSTINKANIDSQNVLKEDKNDTVKAENVLRGALDTITKQRYKNKILDVGQDAPALVLADYHKVNKKDVKIQFGWETMDDMSGGAMGGDVISTVGRPASGKTYLQLAMALKNWRAKNNVLFASMEMNHLAISQRVAAMYANTGATQLKLSAYSSSTYNRFKEGLQGMKKEESGFYVVDGNLAAYADDLYMLAAYLDCSAIYIDGAYLMRHKNDRLDRFTRVAENAELMKRYSTDLDIPTFASWQFNRTAGAKGKGKFKGEKAGLEDIGYSDAIGQISTIVMGMHQEEGIETMQSRSVEIMKGRNGETGNFKIHWDFINMNFNEITEEEESEINNDLLKYI